MEIILEKVLLALLFVTKFRPLVLILIKKFSAKVRGD